MEELVLDGKTYVKASKVAKDLGYASDYVGQLCRAGTLDAHLIGRTWYVNPKELGEHKTEKKRISRTKAREHARKAIEEHRQKNAETKNIYKNIDIRYESDTRELIPNTETRRISIKSETPVPQRYDDGEDTGLEIENKGEKILMSGNLTVVDVTDGPVGDGTVFLHPGRFKSGAKEIPTRKKIEEETDIEDMDPQSEDVSDEIADSELVNEEGEEEATRVVSVPRMSFIERIQEANRESTTPQSTVLTEAESKEVMPEIKGGEKVSYIVPVILMTFTLLTSVLSFCIESNITFDSSIRGVEHEYAFTPQHLEEIISSKIKISR